MKNIWVATGNGHKLGEIQQILGDNYKVKGLKDLQRHIDIIEDGNTYYENALKKAQTLFELVQEPVFADDSGLEVDALDGAPGIFSARFAGEEGNHQKNILKLLTDLQDVTPEQRGARFRCVIVYLDKYGTDKSFVGVLPGRIGTSQSGTGGFGYDPVFYAEGYNCSLAELSAEEKNKISHRGRAMEKLKAFLQG